ncbi:hypothetical protein GobsT_43840 [Gemmata obscuriglobus]|uniref:Uncharacterized protein n=1 Tax=Gemmata obscuriglobus TaxID=114 RepID=A0A2Z3GXP6_9BACT|nr:hypothetical protein [Gemmata obscuriglobus]AWM38168.1 hypothetical protein C1280_15010 [Gemmata obscuriglobus]QEG28939.1 hypothetical protein GobsT_37280 [Gemmata obscuriglobus]QEG29586.1 hypothetical protein GobsT_43840 [Gemmata obscuriglobus]VTS07453.1 unnamed protein product [Gemmata obscuriglobus UQM 2246]VTS08853.1 unnamed protein product [Gemmata obscuriglobus UQM 2246]
MDEGSRNVVAFLGALTQAQHTLLQLANDLADGGLVADQHEPYIRISMHAWRYLEIGVEVDTAVCRRYNLRLTVDWSEDQWKIQTGAASQVVRGAVWDAESYLPDQLGLPVRSATTLDGFAVELREATMSGCHALRQLLASGRVAAQEAEPGAAPDTAR